MDYLSGWCKSKRRLDGFTTIVTGSNTGIGKETTLDFYKRGARVIMACRNIENAKQAKENIELSTKDQKNTGELLIEQLDLCSMANIQQFVQRVKSQENSIHILICNAGVMMCPESYTEDGFETHIGSNHLGHALLTLLLMPLLIRSGGSRIVYVSSIVHWFYNLDLDDLNFKRTLYNPFEAYSKSKVANILFAKALDLKLKEHNIEGVTTYSVHPGLVKTGIGRHFPQTAWSIIPYIFENYIFSWCWKTPRCGAQTSIYCAVDERCENESGYYYSDCSKASCSKQCRSESEAKKLWDVTIYLLNLQGYDPFKL